MSDHGRIDEYLDGQLDAAGEDAFLAHVADCAPCQDELHAAVQLRDREDALRAAAPPVVLAPTAPVIPLAARRRRWLAPTVAVGLAAAAAAAIALTRGKRPDGAAQQPAPTLALASTRGLEARLAWDGAAGYRPYDAMRSGGMRPETIDPRALAALAERGDCAGVAAAYLLSGELARAEAQYQRCPSSPDLDADRAALALARGEPAAALQHADRALAARGDHPVARWNRALALRELGLGLAAAAEFDRAATDPTWAEEARARAAAVRAPLVAMRDGYAEVVAAGRAMVAGGPPIPAPLARSFPARARLRLDDAVRLAPDRARLDELRPLAETLDGLAGDGLVARLDTLTLRPAPAAVAQTYQAWVEAGTIADEAAWQRWRRDARKADARGLLLGAMLLAGRGADDAATVALATASDDPWTAALGQVVAAGALKDPDAADRQFADVEARCAAGAVPAYPCLRAAYARAMLAFARYQVPATAAAVGRALDLIASTGEWAVRFRTLYLAGNAARLRGQHGLAIAYFDEAVAASDDCPLTRAAGAVAAELVLRDGRVADAAARARSLPTCGDASLVELSLAVDLARTGAPVRPAAEVRAGLAAVASTDPTDAAIVTLMLARLDLGTDVGAVERLRTLSAERSRPHTPGRPDPGQVAAAVLAVEAGRAGRWDDAVAAVATRLGVPAPTTCGLVLASEVGHVVAVAIDRAGGKHGGVERAVAPSVLAAVTGCDRVDVLALPPHLGAPLALAPTVPWRFVTGPARAADPGAAHRVVVADARPPTTLGLAALTAPPTAPGAEVIRGDAATVARIAAAARDATLLEFHVHAINVAASDAPALALTDGPGGWAATAEMIAGWRLPRAPVVLLADCDAAVGADYDELYWGLPRAFLDAGAGAVVAALVPVPDAEAGAVFAAIGDAISAGEAPAVVVARMRAEKIGQDPTSWVRYLVVFE